jgi:error-prone DNA polymerase
MPYAELLCLTNFTFQHGASHPWELVTRAHALGYSALAIVDECSLAGIVRAHEAARAVGLKLVIGSQFRLKSEDRIALLARGPLGYSQLCELITQARRRADKGAYRIEPADFETHALSDTIGLWIPGPDIASERARWFAHLPLAEHHLTFTHDLAQNSPTRLKLLTALAQELPCGLLAAGDVHYHARTRRPLHDLLTALRHKTTLDQLGRRGFPNGERHLRKPATLARLYPPALLIAAAGVAARCTFCLSQLRYDYPEELVPADLTAIAHLRALTYQGATRRWPQGVPHTVQGLIEKELALIQDLNFQHYFLTVEDLVRFARSRGILCQGRGSAANSAVCYCLGVTEVDPARMDLLLERFISKERHEPPDIDIDFEHHRREEVFQYLYGKYGRHRAALTATVITYRRRLAIRDVARVLGFPLDLVNALSQSVHWFDDPTQLPAELQKLGFDPSAHLATLLVRLVHELIGFPRHLSQHVGGFVLSQQPLSTLVPIENAAMPERTIIQWDKNDLDTLGLLKVDCLALGMLSAIRRALALKSQFEGRPFQMQDVPPEDPATYDMLCRGDSVGVFQVESRAQMAMLPRLKPRTYFDLVIQVAIIRPGPIQGGMVHPYLRRRAGIEPVLYPNPELERILKRTLGVPLFQEQVMELAMTAAGFSAGEADQVRRSMAAWQRRGGLQEFRARLLEGMRARGYTPQFAESIYQQILGFGAYGFPQSHAASFALLVYVSAWLRCHAPQAFVAALLNSWPMGFYAPAQLIHDAGRHGVRFRPIDVQTSHWECTLEAAPDGTPEVRLGLCLVHGFSKARAQALEAARLSAGPFLDVDDVAHRTGCHRGELWQLAAAGALGTLSGHRRAALWSALGVEHLPALLAGRSARESPVALTVPTEGEDILWDYRATGVTLGRHPLALLREKLNRLGVRCNHTLRALPDGHPVCIAGLVTHRQRPETASGVMFVSLEDDTGWANVILWRDTQDRERQAVFSAHLMVVEGTLQNAYNVIHIVGHTVKDYSHWLGRLPSGSRDFM